MSTQWLWLTLPVTIIGMIAVPTLAWRLYTSQRDGVLVSIPLAAEQAIDISATGPMLLHAQGPRFSIAFKTLNYRLTDLADNSDVPLSTVLLRQKSSGLSHTRLSLRSFDVARPGRYELSVTGLTAEAPMAGHGLAITKDNRAGLMWRIVVLVFASIALLAGTSMSFVIYLINR